MGELVKRSPSVGCADLLVAAAAVVGWLQFAWLGLVS
jgi:hypothetical protein